MRAPLRRPTKLIGAKWLRHGSEDFSANMEAEGSSQNHEKGGIESGEKSGINIQRANIDRGDKGGEDQVVDKIPAFLNSNEPITGVNEARAG